jgi:predicted 3-demethylubiquinone-9 3-methyltransferase (glyoxalase superfamily)
VKLEYIDETKEVNDMEQVNQKLFPFFTFHGNAEEAMNFYAAVLPGAKIDSIVHFEEGQRGDVGKVLTGKLSFMGQCILFMDMNASYDCPPFSWAASFYVSCNSEAEFDCMFNGLAKDGFVMMKEEPFLHFRKVAWVTDKYGVTWQPVLE